MLSLVTVDAIDERTGEKVRMAVNPEWVASVVARGGNAYTLVFGGSNPAESYQKIEHEGDLESLCRRLNGIPEENPTAKTAEYWESRPVPKTWDAFRLDVAESLRKGLKAEGVEGALAPVGSHRLSAAIGSIADIRNVGYGELVWLQSTWTSLSRQSMSRGAWDDFIVSELHQMISDILREINISGPAERLIAEASVSWFLRRHWKRPF